MSKNERHKSSGNSSQNRRRVQRKIAVIRGLGGRYPERGQTTLEFVVVLPLFIGILFLGLALAVGFHVHHLSASLALESSSLESAMSGQGMGFVNATGNKTAPSAGLTAEIAEFPYAWLSGSGVRGHRFTIHGNVNLPWSPLGVSMDALLRGTTYVPVWEFNGAP
jgi:hypothetical protein